MKRIIIIVCTCCVIVFMGGICLLTTVIYNTSNPNHELVLNEFKAYSRETVYLDFKPNIEKISEIQVYSNIDISTYDAQKNGNIIYNTKKHMETVIGYLNDMKLVDAAEDELPNQSADGSISFYDNEKNVVKNLVLYGEVFIKDLSNDRLYRKKYTRTGIIEGLNNIEFD